MFYITASNILDTLQILNKPSLLWEVHSVIQHVESLPYVDCQRQAVRSNLIMLTYFSILFYLETWAETKVITQILQRT